MAEANCDRVLLATDDPIHWLMREPCSRPIAPSRFDDGWIGLVPTPVFHEALDVPVAMDQ